jgi:hypothetical protein
MDTTRLPSPEDLAALLEYCEDGTLRWLPRPRDMFEDERIFKSWNGRYAGKPALTADNGNGYRFGVVRYARVYAHHVVWCLVHGVWPDREIDHIDRDRANNRISNLRCVSHMENCTNLGTRSTNTSGHANIVWRRDRGVWVFQARANGRLHSGHYQTLNEALSARDAFRSAIRG